MRGYVLPIVVTFLLSAPMLWRLEGEVEQGAVEAPATRVIFHDTLPTGADAFPYVQGTDNEVRFEFTSIAPRTDDDASTPAPLLQAEIED